MVDCPWGRDRANRDRPPFSEVIQRRMNYQQLLDEQSAKQAEARKRTAEQNAALEASTARSLATSTHEWGSEACNPKAERAIFQELLATVQYKKNRALENKNAEIKDFARWKKQAERQLAMEWHAQQHRVHQDKMDLAATWKAAAEDKKRRAEEERVRTLALEREAMLKIREGMAPPRRMRKVPEPLV